MRGSHARAPSRDIHKTRLRFDLPESKSPFMFERFWGIERHQSHPTRCLIEERKRWLRNRVHSDRIMNPIPIGDWALGSRKPCGKTSDEG